MSISIRFTYSTVTPESVEYGDYASAGFCDMNGNIISDNNETDPSTIPDNEIEQWQNSGDLYYCVDAAINLGINYNAGSWFASYAEIKDYSTCEEIEYNLHITGLTDTQYKAIARMIDNGRLTDDDQEYLNSIDGQLSLV
jgi:hypothetical protein